MIQLYQGDCLEILPTLKNQSIDAIVADPPYGMKWDSNTSRFSGGTVRRGKKVNNFGDIQGDDRPFNPSIWLGFPKLILWGANHYARCLQTGTTLVWIKRNDAAFGTFLSDAEIGWMKGGHGVYCFRKLFPPPSRIAEGGLKTKVAHPTQKPIALMRWCIRKLKLKPGSTVLDPYMGSGSTALAALAEGMNFIGIEVDPTYFAIAQRRIEAAQASTPLLDRIGASS